MPQYIVPSIGGHIPYITPDVLEKLKLPLLQNIECRDLYVASPGLICNFGRLMFYENMVREGKDIRGYFTPHNDTKSIVFATSEIDVGGTGKVFSTPMGRKNVCAKEYLSMMEVARPYGFEVLSNDLLPMMGKKKQRKILEMNSIWRKECIAGKPDGLKLYVTIHVGVEEGLRKLSLENVVDGKVDGYIVSGLLNYSGKDQINVLNSVMEMLPKESIVIAKEVSVPLEVIEMVNRGVGMFSGDYPYMMTQLGYGIVFWVEGDLGKHISHTSRSKIALRDKVYAKDSRPISSTCECFTCKNHSRAYINHLLNAHEMLADVLLYIHNLQYYCTFFKIMGNHLKKNTFAQFKAQFIQNFE